jgi:hypothetical protein
MVGVSDAYSQAKLDRSLLTVPSDCYAGSKALVTLNVPCTDTSYSKGYLGSITAVLQAPKVAQANLEYTGLKSFYTINAEGNTVAAPGVLLLNYAAEIAYNRIHYAQATFSRIFYSGGQN